MLVLLIILSIILVTFIGISIKFLIGAILEKDDCLITSMAMTLAGSFFFVLILIIMIWISLPHHGANPSIKDVPNEAHIDTIKTICGNDTTITYEIKWNE